ncbi:hypothetical protein KVP10_08610 [Candidimonas humi]|uniref:Phage tail assembly chaperone protein, TAC n=1 Tax=Candidimonas humi TaxID=683355 RepID=A0ABV8NWB4_9BURK|nr:hypothetical protein [Candidimonas humi]MBV6304948.1 hypothetical protein [Candidimonas humi]
MSLTVKSVVSPQWADADHTSVKCDVVFNELDGTHPFCARADDPMPYGAQLFTDLVAGKYGTIAEYVAPPPVIPQRVSAAQGGIALINASLMDAVQTAVDAADTPAAVKWAWARAQDWERSSPALAYLAGKAGISSQQMDDLFVAAAQITA